MKISIQVYCFDLRRPEIVLKEFVNNNFQCSEEINQISIKDHFLAAGDDNGEIKIFDLDTNKIFKTIRSAHSNVDISHFFFPPLIRIVFRYVALFSSIQNALGNV